ncbi:hypothetical protein CDL15_Pgr025655 [Punica granatum]|uniref:Uncharacterized protein n=1 Tax=Punica granatum TaxID=22663 RepID=A0A218WAY8_PUNGR|nr:hypothetical protein CDL15_Pgr025655 [Punica granatum]PKI51913.1 hypothetical protein CRG98_027694 [Punica granatum]
MASMSLGVLVALRRRLLQTRRGDQLVSGREYLSKRTESLEVASSEMDEVTLTACWRLEQKLGSGMEETSRSGEKASSRRLLGKTWKFATQQVT